MQPSLPPPDAAREPSTSSLHLLPEDSLSSPDAQLCAPCSSPQPFATEMCVKDKAKKNASGYEPLH